MAYFDCAATTKPTEQVIEDITKAMRENWYNPSSISEEARQVKLKMAHARQQIADYINCKPEEIIFTSGGSESNNLAIKGYYTNKNNDVYGLFCSTIEHPSIYNIVHSYQFGGFLAKCIKVDKGGQIDLNILESYLKGTSSLHPYTDITWHPLVCISYVNNELGSTNNIGVISQLVHKYNGYLLVDAVQAFEYKSIDVKSMGIDMLSASFHKFGGVRGCGFLYVKTGIELIPLIEGGHQENNLRAGTEPSYLIEAMGNRIQYLKEHKSERLQRIADINWKILYKLGLIDGNTKIEGLVKNGEHCSPHIISLTIPNVSAQELIPLMNIDGVIVSAGSACSSGDLLPSRVLKSIGLTDEEAFSTIRISFDEFTTDEDIDALIDSLIKNVSVLKLLHSEDEK